MAFEIEAHPEHLFELHIGIESDPVAEARNVANDAR